MAGMSLKFFRRKGGMRGIIFKTLEWVVMANWCCSLRVLEGGAAWKDGHFSTSKCDSREGGIPDLLPPGPPGNPQAAPLEATHAAAVPRPRGTMLASAELPLLSSILMMGHVPPNSTASPHPRPHCPGHQPLSVPGDTSGVLRASQSTSGLKLAAPGPRCDLQTCFHWLIMLYTLRCFAYIFFKISHVSAFPAEPGVLAAPGLHSHRAATAWSPRGLPLSCEAQVLGRPQHSPHLTAVYLASLLVDLTSTLSSRSRSCPGMAVYGRGALPTQPCLPNISLRVAVY